MKEHVIDVLVYLFENYIDTDDTNKPDKDTLESELEQVGFQQLNVDKALDWLEGMVIGSEATDEGESRSDDVTARIYSKFEMNRLDITCRGYLVFLEHVGVLNALTREIVIERLMAFDTDELDLEQMKWVILMVLFYQPGHEVAFAWMEDLLFDDMEAVFH